MRKEGLLLNRGRVYYGAPQTNSKPSAAQVCCPRGFARSLAGGGEGLEKVRQGGALAVKPVENSGCFFLLARLWP